MSEVWTIGRLLQWTTDFLQQRGADSPRLDAEVLLAHVRGCPRIALYTAFADVADESLKTQFRELVKQRAAGKPVAYLVGQREFYSLPFRVTSDVLIPRPETEFVVVGLLDQLKGQSPPEAGWRIADIGTGSGIIGICLAKWLATAQVTAVDVSPAALAIARENATTLGVAERIEFVESDLFAKVSPGRTFHAIVSNPPYIRTAEMAELAKDVRDYEPHLALEAGPRGTEVIERLIPQAAERLEQGGWLLIEVSPMIEPAVRQLIAAETRLEPQSTINDLAGHPRVVRARRK